MNRARRLAGLPVLLAALIAASTSAYAGADHGGVFDTVHMRAPGGAPLGTNLLAAGGDGGGEYDIKDVPH